MIMVGTIKVQGKKTGVHGARLFRRNLWKRLYCISIHIFIYFVELGIMWTDSWFYFLIYIKMSDIFWKISEQSPVSAVVSFFSCLSPAMLLHASVSVVHVRLRDIFPRFSNIELRQCIISTTDLMIEVAPCVWGVYSVLQSMGGGGGTRLTLDVPKKEKNFKST